MLKLLARSATGQADDGLFQHFWRTAESRERETGPRSFTWFCWITAEAKFSPANIAKRSAASAAAACLNACPVYRKIGGHAYGSVYPGPIGALITPLFQGLGKFKDLPQASSLCGACYEACPVKINIPKHLINMRRDIVAQHLNGPIERADLPPLGVGPAQPVHLSLDRAVAEMGPPAPSRRKRVGKGFAQNRRRLDPDPRHARSRAQDVSRVVGASETMSDVSMSVMNRVIDGRWEEPSRSQCARRCRRQLHEPLVRLVHSEIGLPELFADRARANKMGVENCSTSKSFTPD